MKRHFVWICLLVTTGCGARTEVEPGESASDVVQIAGAAANTCARRRGGRVACWGESFGGAPVDVASVDDAVELAVGMDRACVLRRSGAVDCWTLDRSLGAGPAVSVLGLDDVVHIGVGPGRACAVRRDGRVSCWGRNIFGTLGDGSGIDHDEPVFVSSLDDAVEVALGDSSTCARRSDGSVVCWGRGRLGQLGDGAFEHDDCQSEDPCSETPVQVIGLDDAAQVSSGLNGSCARRAHGGVVAWGWNGEGEVGDGTTTDRSVPAVVQGIDDARLVYAGYQRKCAVLSEGELTCWGAGVGSSVTPILLPEIIQGLHGVIDVTGGWYHLCALSDDGQVFCWGDNQWFQLGDGTTTERATPAAVVGL